MRHSILIASLFLLGCSGGDPDESAEIADEDAEDIASAYHDALDRADEVEAIIEQEKADLDAAIEEAEGGGTDD